MLSTQSLGISGTKAVLWLRCSSAWTEQNRGLTSVLMTNAEYQINLLIIIIIIIITIYYYCCCLLDQEPEN